MILTKTVTYYGKEIPVESLSKTSGKKVKVKCPTCGMVRDAYYRVIVNGNHRCHKCTLKDNRKYLKKDDKYGRLTVVKPLNGKSVCKCICGGVVTVDNYALRKGTTKSCSCLKSESFKNTKVNRGSEHGNWKGGISGERHRMIGTKEYKMWRTNVFERNNYTCQKCGQVGYKLNAHHIINYAKNENSRLEVSNGITFCEDCHRIFHKLYGRKNISLEHVNEFINNQQHKIHNPLTT